MMNYYLEISPACCERSMLEKAIVLGFPYKKEYIHTYPLIPYSKRTPKWLVKGYTNVGNEQDGYWVVDGKEAKYCPFCAKELPELELNPDAINYSVYDSEDGEYCDNCNERNMSCNCLPPHFRWKPINQEVIIPIMDDSDEEE